MDNIQKELYYSKGSLECEGCHSKKLKTILLYDGISKYPYELNIICENCGRATTVARLLHDAEIRIKEDINKIDREV